MGAGKAADLTYWEGAARMIASVSTTSKIIVEKSTVPVKTADAIEKARRGPLRRALGLRTRPLNPWQLRGPRALSAPACPALRRRCGAQAPELKP